MENLKLSLLMKAQQLKDDEQMDLGIRELLTDMRQLPFEDQLEVTFAMIDALH